MEVLRISGNLDLLSPDNFPYWVHGCDSEIPHLYVIKCSLYFKKNQHTYYL